MGQDFLAIYQDKKPKCNKSKIKNKASEAFRKKHLKSNKIKPIGKELISLNSKTIAMIATVPLGKFELFQLGSSEETSQKKISKLCYS